MMLDTAPRTAVLPDGRTVGYRMFGDGPPVALLHASPRSAAALLPLGARLADRYTVFAFDTPGFGWSDALRIERPDAADFADALIATFDALGIVKAPIYGSHTGAAVAVAAGMRHPARVPALALDGYAIFTPAEQAESMANYLSPIRPAWDGTHLAFLWSRVKDQFTVFPWYLNAQVARLPRALAPLDLRQAVVLDFLAAGDAYRAAYAAAFRFDGLGGLRALTVPTLVLARSDDLLFSHLDAVQDVPQCVTVRRLTEDHGAWADAVRDALAHGGAGETINIARPHSEIRVPGGVIGVRRSAGVGAQGRQIVLLPGIPGSARGEAALTRALAVTRPVVAVDLPGFGASSLSGEPDVAAIARAITAALRTNDFDVVAMGESASVGCALATRGLVLIDPVADDRREATVEHMANVTPRDDGGHLLAAWHQLRDACLWRPWFVTDPVHAVSNGTDPDVLRLHAILTDWMRGGTEGRRTLATVMAPALSDVLPAGAAIITPPDDRHARAAAILHALERAR